MALSSWLRTVDRRSTAIAAGEELLISYVDEELPLEARRAQLLPYGFLCQCSRCLDEERQAAPSPLLC